MKKLLALILALALVLVLAACGNKGNVAAGGNTESTNNTTETSDTAETTSQDTTEDTSADNAQDSVENPTNENTNSETSEPSQGSTSTPSQGSTSTPSQGSTSTPSQGSTSTPSQGSTSTPSQDSTSTPSQGSTSTPVSCSHSYKDATCTAPKTCSKCGATEGSVAAHNWQEATCSTPKTCKTCGAKEGTVSHDMHQHKCRICGYEDELLASFDVSKNLDGSVYAYIYKTSVDGEYALAFYGNGATKDFMTSDAPYNSLSSKIKHVEFGEGITRIGACTLFTWGGWELKSLKFPNTLTEIGSYAFEMLDLSSSENGLQLPNSLVRIGYSAFEDANIGKLVIPDSVMYLEERAFIGARLTHITFGSGIQEIQDEVFSVQHDNKILDSLEKTEYKNGYYVGDKTNPYYLFVGVTNKELTSLEIHPDTFMIYDASLWDCVFLKTVVIPDSVKIIGSMSFLGCASLNEVTIGSGIKYCAEWAFQDCLNLKTVNYNGTKADWDAINFVEYWDRLMLSEGMSLNVICTDGTIPIVGEKLSYH